MKKPKYAANTHVSTARSRAEIEEIITRYGASKFISGIDSEVGEALIGFQVKETQVRLTLRLPDPELAAKTDTGRKRYNQDLIYKAHEQACRSAWRALALVVKAKFEAVESGITSFEEEFLAHVVVPGGKTVGQSIIPTLGKYDGSDLPKLLPGPRG